MGDNSPRGSEPDGLPERPDASNDDIHETTESDDRFDVEITHGTDIWSGEQAPIAEDLLALRERRRRGDNLSPRQILTEDELAELATEAHRRGDDRVDAEVFSELILRDPERFLRLFDHLASNSLDSPDPAAEDAPDTSEDDPPVRQPRRAIAL